MRTLILVDSSSNKKSLVSAVSEPWPLVSHAIRPLAYQVFLISTKAGGLGALAVLMVMFPQLIQLRQVSI